MGRIRRSAVGTPHVIWRAAPAPAPWVASAALPSGPPTSYREQLLLLPHGSHPPLCRRDPPRHIESSSCSLCFNMSSISATTSWVCFSSSFSARSRSSLLSSPSFSRLSSSWRGVATSVAHPHPALLGPVPHHLHEVLAAVLGELRERQPDHLAVVRGIDPEVALLDRLLDRLDRALVVGRDREHPGLGHPEAGDLLQRHLAAVGVDLQLLDQRRRRATRFAPRRTPTGGARPPCASCRGTRR